MKDPFSATDREKKFNEASYWETGLIKEYYIDNFLVNRAEFINQIGDLTQEMVEKLRNGEEIEVNHMTFRVSNWNGL